LQLRRRHCYRNGAGALLKLEIVMSTQTRISLTELLEELDGFDHRIPLDWLVQRLHMTVIGWSEIARAVRFAPDTYARNLLRCGPAYQALILCWRSGQRSPIHDHRGSSCAVQVLRGTCTETIFQRTRDGHIFPTETHRLPAGTCCGSQDADIHQISNLESPGQDLITLHLYSPPLVVMEQYSLTSPIGRLITDPIGELLEGAGI
jgi:cysteine dioxygenase